MRYLITMLLVVVCVTLQAQLRLPAILSSGMVLQQEDSVALWGWAGPAQKITVSVGWSKDISTTNTSSYSTWKLKLKTPAAGGPYTINIKTDNAAIELTDVLVGEVWVCSGQSNMEWSYWNGLQDIRAELATSYNPKIRFFNIPKSASDTPQDDVKAQWQICDSVSLKDFSAVGYFFGKRLNQELNIPIGLVNASWGGTPAEVWTPKALVENNKQLADAAAKQSTNRWWPTKPGVTFNTMIHPITPFAIAGSIWYQGESNTGTANTYEVLFTTMIDSWRKAWKKEFPFYYVQIAPFQYGNHNVGALLQEAQTKSLSYPKTGMVVITDLVDNINDIHPTNKHDVGYRLANLALADTYNRELIDYRSPQLIRTEQNKNKIELYFDNASEGLIIRTKTAEGFFISGNEEHWFPADVKVDGNKITLSSKKVSTPIYVRYGFGNTAIGNVFNKNGLPLCPFRTDSFKVDTSPIN